MTDNRPRLRFSLRTLFVAVTLLCVGLWLWQWTNQRRAEYRSLAYEHLIGANTVCHFRGPRETPDEVIQRHHDYYRRYREYHEKLFAKYVRATKFPWLPVEPDPPEPDPPEPP